MKDRVKSRKKWILPPLIVFSMLAAFTLNGALSQSPQPQTSLGSNWEQSCSNGICTLTVYSYQKYYQEKGEWLFLNESFGTGNCQKGYAFCVDKNNFQFHVKSTYDNPMIKRGSTNITLSLHSLGNSIISKKSPTIAGNVITYKDILPDVDLKYTYTWAGVKEEIILNKPSALTFSEKDINTAFKMSVPKNTEKSKNKIVLYNNPEEVFVIRSLIARDSNHSVIPLKFSMDSEGNFNLTLPKKWFTDKSRVYPITIDPTIQLDDADIPWDGWIIKCDPLTDCEAVGYPDTYTRVGPNSPNYVGKLDLGYMTGLYRSAIHWDTSSIPDNVSILNANMTVYWEAIGINSIPTDPVITLTHMEGDESSYPDNNQSNALFFQDMANGTAYDSAALTVTGFTTYNLSTAIPDIENGLINDKFTIGVYDAIEDIEVTVSSFTGSTGNASHRPSLIIVYEPWASESEGDQAIEEGIQNELGDPVIYTDQKIHILKENGSQYLGYFDKVTQEANQTWVFNYITSGEEFTLMPHLVPILYVGEAENLAYEEIVDQVESLINSTKV